MSQIVKYVSLVRMRLDGELYRAGDILPGLDAETAEPLIVAGWVVEGVAELPEGTELEDGQSTPAAKAKKGKGGQ